jgi:hypothetical protein
VATKDLAYGQRTIRRILDELDHPQELEEAYARAILDQAVTNAGSRPTPQAPMAASNMVVEGASIGPSLRGTPEEAVAIGSEFGSSLYPQFHHSPAPRGLWLYPAAEDLKVIAAMDGELEKMLQKAVRMPL